MHDKPELKLKSHIKLKLKLGFLSIFFNEGVGDLPSKAESSSTTHVKSKLKFRFFVVFFLASVVKLLSTLRVV